METDVMTTAPDRGAEEVGGPGSDAPGARPRSDRERTGRRLVSFVVVVACCLYVFFVVHGPTLVLSDSTPTGGDMGAHVWGPAYLRDHLLPQLRLTGWTQDWYAGFPAYTFYMVVPSLAIVLLDVGLFPVTSWWGAVASGVLVVAAILAALRLQRRGSRLVRVLGWVGLVSGVLLLVDLPYNVAFKLVAVSGIVAFPAAVWYLLAGLSLRQPGPELGAVASLAFLMDRSLFHIYGGNIASTMAGEFAFSISITLALFALGSIARGVADGRRRATTAVLIGAALLCHVIPGLFFLAVGALLIVALRPSREAFRWALPVGSVGALLAMWWYLPFYFRSDYLNDMGWEKLGIVTCSDGQRRSWNEIWRALLPFAPHQFHTCPVPAGSTAAPPVLQDPNMLHGRVFFVLAAVGLLLSVVMAVRAGIWLGLLALVSAVAFVVMPQHRFWNARVLPFYYLAVYLLAAVGVTLLVRAVVLVASGRWRVPGLATVATISGVAWVAMYVMLAMSLRTLPGGQMVTRPDGAQAFRWMGLETTYQGVVPGWARWNFEGLEAKPGTSVDPATGRSFIDRKDSDDYFAMIDEMRRVGREVGCGRAYWEYDGDLNRYGTPMAPMLLPYFTDGCIGSMEGLYFEASSTTPFHFVVQSELSKAPSRPQRFPMVGVFPQDAPKGFNGSWPYRVFDLDQGVRHLQLLGVRYFMTYTPETREAAQGDERLELVGESGRWAVFEVSGVELVEPLEYLPNRWTDVTHNIHEWARPAIEWFDDAEQWDVVRSTDGPDSWPATRGATTWFESLAQRAVGKRIDRTVRREAPAPDLEVREVSTTEDSISFEVSEVGSPVLVRTSYFPNWEADGAEGPYRVTPNFMVVVPTSERVTLTYGRSGLEWLAWLVSLVGVLGLVGLLRWRRPALEGPPREWFGDRDTDDTDGDDGDDGEGHAQGAGGGHGDHDDPAPAADGPLGGEPAPSEPVPVAAGPAGADGTEPVPGDP